jgi:hypothetical protein
MDPRMKKAREMWVSMGGPDTNIVDPPNWLFNQDKMRSMYEDSIDKPFHPLNMNNELKEYMKFMYNSFPSGYGKFLIDEYHKLKA